MYDKNIWSHSLYLYFFTDVSDYDLLCFETYVLASVAMFFFSCFFVLQN